MRGERLIGNGLIVAASPTDYHKKYLIWGLYPLNHPDFLLYHVTEVIDMSFRRLLDLRKKKNLTQKEVGKYLKINRQTYSLYETGKRDLTSDILMALATFYHVSADYLVELTDDPTPYPQANQDKKRD